MRNFKEKNERAIILFADLRGSGIFFRRISHPETQLIPFWRKWRAIVNEFEDETGFFVKRLGDGFMGVLECDEKNAPSLNARAIDQSFSFCLKARRLINSQNPRPNGIRVRLVYEYVWKVPCRQFGCDYVADNVNLAEYMIHKHEDKMIVVHQSVYDQIRKSARFRKKYRTRKLHCLKPCSSIYDQDLQEVWEIKKR